LLAPFHPQERKRSWNAVETLSVCKSKKNSVCQSAGKVIVFIFWDADRVIHVELMPLAIADAYCSFL
jgi:hypothetical protein